MATIFCIPGSGDPYESGNYFYRSRLHAAAALWKPGDTIFCFGCQQAGLQNSEARLGANYLQNYLPEIPLADYMLNEEVKSTARTARAIAAIYADTAPHDIVIINTPLHLRRTQTLVTYHMHALGFGWGPHERITYHASDDVLKFYILQMGRRRAYTRRLGEIVRECLATAKAMVDPNDKKINQNRKAGRLPAKIFG